MLVPMVPAATAAGIFGLGPTPWRTIGTGSRYKLVPMRQHRNRFVPPPGAKCRRRYRHRLVGPTGAYCAANGTGSCHDPVLADTRAKGTGLCLDPVLLNNILHRVISTNRCILSTPINTPTCPPSRLP